MNKKSIYDIRTITSETGPHSFLTCIKLDHFLWAREKTDTIMWEYKTKYTCDRFVRMWKWNESVTSVKNSNAFVTPVKNSCEFFTDVTNTYDSFISVKDSHDFFTSVIRSHDICDKFTKKCVYKAFIFTAAYLPKHNNVLWKEKCWGDIPLFLRRPRIARTRRWVSRLNRKLFCP